MKNKNYKKGFTLIELLVVILIIGILAAVALPQYQMAVAKSKYNSIKTLTRNYADAMMRYYLVNNQFTSLSNLDIDISELKDGNCTFISEPPCSSCFITVFGTRMGYYWNFLQNKQFLCYTTSLDPNHITNRLCQKETNKNSSQGSCTSGQYCLYRY